MTSIGMNLGQVSYWGTNYPFIDRFKTAGAWTAQGTNPGEVVLNENGYPTGMPTGASRLYTMIGVDPVADAMTDRYVVTWSGEATIRFNSAQVISSEPGRMVIEHVGDKNRVQMMLTSINPDDPIRDIHVVREDQLELFEAGQVFNPAFLEKASQWDTLRFMDWARTNNSETVTWDDRAKLSDATWGIDNGVPLEVMVRLANETGADMWYNIPAEADDEFVRQAVAYIRDNLAPGQTLRLEYSNEVWNWMFDQADSALAKGNLLWGKDANGDGVIDKNDKQEHYASGWVRYYGLRSAQVAAIAGEVFAGQDDRLVNVLAPQTHNKGLVQHITKGIADAGLGTVGELFEEYAVTTYFGGGLSASSNAADRAKVLEWARSGEAGVTKALQEMATGSLLSNKNGSLAAMPAVYEWHKATADQYGLKLVAYEGGAHIEASKYSAADQPEVIAFFQRVLTDPRMSALYAKMVDDFAAAGGELLVAFNDSSSASKSGHWGVLESIYEEGSARYNALVEAQRDYLNAIGGAIPPAEVPSQSPGNGAADVPSQDGASPTPSTPPGPSTPPPEPTPPIQPSTPSEPTPPAPEPTAPAPEPTQPVPTVPPVVQDPAPTQPTTPVTPAPTTPVTPPVLADPAPVVPPAAPSTPAPLPVVPATPAGFLPPTLADVLPSPATPAGDRAPPPILADTAFARYRESFIDVALASAQEMLAPQPLHAG